MGVEAELDKLGLQTTGRSFKVFDLDVIRSEQRPSQHHSTSAVEWAEVDAETSGKAHQIDGPALRVPLEIEGRDYKVFMVRDAGNDR